MHNSNYHNSVKNSKTIWTKFKTLEMVKKALTSWDNSGLNVYIQWQYASYGGVRHSHTNRSGDLILRGRNFLEKEMSTGHLCP